MRIAAIIAGTFIAILIGLAVLAFGLRDAHADTSKPEAKPEVTVAQRIQRASLAHRKALERCASRAPDGVGRCRDRAHHQLERALIRADADIAIQHSARRAAAVALLPH